MIRSRFLRAVSYLPHVTCATMVAIITGVSSVQCRTVCRVYVPGAMDLAATEDIDDILNCIRTD